MSVNTRYNFKKILAATIWLLVGMGTIVLLGAAMYKKNSNHCRAVGISIEGVKNNFFIDKADVNTMLEEMNFGKLMFRPLNTFDLAGMETFLEKNEWIKSAELYFDNNDVLRINIMEREPVVRIFNAAGSSFYIDSSLKKLSLSNKFSARLPVFTNFPVTGRVFSKADSILLNEVKNVATYIAQDPFWMAQIEQIDITPNGDFEMIPKIGNQVIIFGPADNMEEKFNNLLVFYKNVQTKVGWNKYSSINVSYKNQVVAVKRGEGDIKHDSLKTIELIKVLVANAQKQAYDSANNIQLVQPKEDNNVIFSKSHDENFMEGQDWFTDTLSKQVTNTGLTPAPPFTKPPAKSTVSSEANSSQFSTLTSTSNEKPTPLPLKKTISKPIIKKPAVQHWKQPKAVMQPKNEY